jgi:hypothetical protein
MSSQDIRWFQAKLYPTSASLSPRRLCGRHFHLVFRRAQLGRQSWIRTPRSLPHHGDYHRLHPSTKRQWMASNRMDLAPHHSPRQAEMPEILHLPCRCALGPQMRKFKRHRTELLQTRRALA